MIDQTFMAYGELVRTYLALEWPATWAAVSSNRAARRAMTAALLDQFMRGSSIPVAAGEIAFAVFPFLP